MIVKVLLLGPLEETSIKHITYNSCSIKLCKMGFSYLHEGILRKYLISHFCKCHIKQIYNCCLQNMREQQQKQEDA